MSTTRLAIWVGVVALAVATLGYVYSNRPPTESSEQTSILFVTGGDSPYWQLIAAGAKEAAQSYNVDLQLKLPTRGYEEQNEIFEAVTAGEVDGVAVSPRAPKKQLDLLRQLSEKVHVVTFDSDAPGSKRLCYVGSDNYSGGKLAARLTKQAIPEGGKVAVLVATFEKDNAEQRVRGFRDEINRVYASDDSDSPPSYEVLEPLEDGIDRQRCRENIQRLLKEHPDLDVFVGLFSYHGPVLLDVYKELEQEKKPQLIVFDEEEAVLEGLEDGRVFATVVQDPFKYGYEAVRMLSVINSGQMVELPIAENGSIFLPCDTVTSDNVDDFRKRLASRLKK